MAVAYCSRQASIASEPLLCRKFGIDRAPFILYEFIIVLFFDIDQKGRCKSPLGDFLLISNRKGGEK